MNQTEVIKKLEITTGFLRSKIGLRAPLIGIIMGSGLDALVEKITIDQIIPYQQIPGFPTSTVSFHKGNMLIGHINNKNVIVMQGRFHFYEGYSAAEVSFPVRVMANLGIKYLFVNNAAGGLNPLYKKGDLVIIEDHINLQPDNPLRGMNDPILGERFVDMSMPYDEELLNKLLNIAQLHDIKMHKGTYVAVQGPSLETRAEIRWLRSLPADVVGMSTVPEIIVANQLNLKCLAVSVVTNECDPDKIIPVDIPEILAVAKIADKNLSDLYMELIKQI